MCPICRAITSEIINRPSFHLEQFPGGSDKTHPLVLYYCQSCVHAYQPAPPSDTLLDEYYKHSYGFYTSPLISDLTKASQDTAIQYISSFITEKSKTCEVGGYDGYFLSQILGEKLLIDASEEGTRIAEEHGIPAVCAFFDEKLAQKYAQQFDFVVARHVIEHIKQPLKFLANLQKILKPGGKLFIETPNLTTFQLRAVHLDHIHYFSPQSLSYLASNADLTMYETKVTSSLAFVSVFTASPKPRELSAIPNTIEKNLKQWLEGKSNVWLWGASTFVSSLLGDHMNLSLDMFAGIIDGNPAKQGKMLASLPIKSAEDVKPSAIVVATYDSAEVRYRIASLGWDVPVITIDELMEG